MGRQSSLPATWGLKMKISDADYQELKELCIDAWAERHMQVGCKSFTQFIAEFQEKGFSPMRTRWDACLWTIPADKRQVWLYRVCGGINGAPDTGINDNHIDTALKKMIKEFGYKWAGK
jgi:hypothetical protein